MPILRAWCAYARLCARPDLPRTAQVAPCTLVRGSDWDPQPGSILCRERQEIWLASRSLNARGAGVRHRGTSSLRLPQNGTHSTDTLGPQPLSTNLLAKYEEGGYLVIFRYRNGHSLTLPPHIRREG